MIYRNEWDDYAAAWLRNLIEAGQIPDGSVDTRSITQVEASDLANHRQHHFFAGIGGWELALQLAGWPSTRRVWTASCPCQPFSSAGAQEGFNDERHLWPHVYRLVRECLPPVIFGEQVASKVAEPWLDLVRADLERLGYTFAAIAFPSASVGAPHIRDRTYWVGHRHVARLEGHAWDERAAGRTGAGRPAAPAGLFDRLVDLHGVGRAEAGRDTASYRATGTGGQGNGAGHAGKDDVQARLERLANVPGIGRGEGRTSVAKTQRDGVARDGAADRPGPVNGFWRAADWLWCRDGKWRPVESGTFPLAHGIPNRVGRLRAYGNAINPVQAAEFITAVMEWLA